MIDLFEAFPKIARLNREIVITEKIDGTNAQVIVDPVNVSHEEYEKTYGAVPLLYTYTPDNIPVAIWAGSRSKLIYPGKQDNAGFAGWVLQNGVELAKLGPGRHFGEWWGQGIQRRYGLQEKRFSLFNVGRWNVDNVPKCVHVVPTLYVGPFSQKEIEACVEELLMEGSHAAPGFKDAEGVVVYHTAADQLFKVTCKDDEKPKGQVNG